MTENENALHFFELANTLKEQKKYEKALAAYEDIVSNADNLEMESLVVSSLLEQEKIHVTLSDYLSALIVSEKLVELTRESKDKGIKAMVLNNNAFINIELGNYPKALKNLFEALNLREELKKPKAIASTLNNIGLLYKNQKKFDKALEYYQKTLQYYTDLQLETSIMRVLNNIGNIYFEKNDNEEAFLYFNKVYQLATKSEDKAYLAYALANVAQIEVKQDKSEYALASYEKSILLLDELGIIDKKGVVLNYQSVCLRKLKRFDRALEIAHQAKKINKKCGAKNALAESYKHLFEIYKESGDFEKALDYHILYKDSQVELFSLEKANTIKNLELTFEMEKSKQALLQMEQEQLLLRRINDELKQFASVASHDMREPLRMISSFSNLLERRLKDRDDPDSKEYLEIIMTNAKRMMVLLEDLLNYAKAGYSQQKPTLVNLEELLIKIRASLHLILVETKGEIIYNKLPEILTQETLLNQLFQNIISNALKFRKKEVAPIIEIKAKKIGPSYQFSISDNGIGIPEEHQERVFSIFNRLHHQTEYQGSGIGLATCKKIIDYFGGKIWVESKVNVGSVFFFTIPIQE